MADDSGDARENVILNKEKLKLIEFVKKFSSKFPKIAVIDRDFAGSLRTISAKKLLLVSHVMSQRRLVLSSKNRGYVSIPESFPIPLERINTFGRVLKRELVWDYLNQARIDKSQKIRFSQPFDDLMISDFSTLTSRGLSTLTSHDLGRLTFHAVVAKQFLIVHPLENESINFDPTAIPLEADLEVQIVEGHRDMSDRDWSQLLEACRIALDKNIDVEPPELERVIVHNNNNNNKILPTQSVKKMKPSYYSHHQQPNRIHVETEATPPIRRINQGMKNMRITDPGERHVTIATGHDNGRQVSGKSNINYRDSGNNYYNHFYKNEATNNNNNSVNVPNMNINNSKVVATNRTSYKTDQNINAGQQRMNIDQKGPKIQSKSSLKFDNRQELKMNSFAELHPNNSTTTTTHQRLAVLGRPNQQNQHLIKVNGGERMMKSHNNYNNMGRTSSQTLFMDITVSDGDQTGSDETFRESKPNRTSDYAGVHIAPGKLLQVPNVQRNNEKLRQEKNSKSLSDLRFDRMITERKTTFGKEESDDADIENESQITVICGKPQLYDFDDRIKSQVPERKTPRIVPMQDFVDRNGMWNRYAAIAPRRTTNVENNKITTRTISNGNKQMLHYTPAREMNRVVSGQESDSSNLYFRSRRPVVKKYPRRFKYSSDADFSGSEDLPRHKFMTPYGYADHDYLPRMRIKMTNNSVSDLDTIVRNRSTYGHDYTSDGYLQPNVRSNRMSGSSLLLEPPLEENSVIKRNVIQRPVEGRYRTRSSPAKVFLMSRQGQVISRDQSANYFSSLQNQQSAPMSRTLISLNNGGAANWVGGNSPPHFKMRSPRDHPEGMYKQVINIR